MKYDSYLKRPCKVAQTKSKKEMDECFRKLIINIFERSLFFRIILLVLSSLILLTKSSIPSSSKLSSPGHKLLMKQFGWKNHRYSLSNSLLINSSKRFLNGKGCNGPILFPVPFYALKSVG